MSKSSVERLIALLDVLSRSERGITRESIKTSVPSYAEYSNEAAFERAFERDKNQLKALGYHLETLKPVPGELYSRYRIRKGSARVLPQFEPGEIAILSALTNVWGRSVPARRAVSRIFTKLGLNGLTNGLTETSAFITAPQEIDTFIEAVAESKAMTFEYRNAQGDISSRTVTVWGLGHRFGQWYVYGFDHAVRDERIFKRDRMRQLKLVNIETHLPPQSFSMKRALEKISDAKTSLAFIEGAFDDSTVVHVGNVSGVPLYNWHEAIGWMIRHHARVADATPDSVPHQYSASRDLQHRVKKTLSVAAKKLTEMHEGAPSISPASIRWVEKSSKRRKETALDHLTRVLRIAEFVRDNAPVSLKETAIYFQTTPGKIRQDLELLWLAVDEESLTLELDKGKVQSLSGADYLVSGAPLSAQEALYLSLTIDQLRRVIPSAGVVDQVFGKLFASYPQLRQLSNRCAISSAVPASLTRFESAIRLRENMRIRYSTSRGSSERTITPQQLILDNDSYYLVAWCHLRRAQRKFKMADIEVLDEEQIIDAVENASSHTGDSLTHQKVIIRYTGQDTRTQQTLESVAERYSKDQTIFEIDLFNNAWFDSLVTDAAGTIEVIAPLEVRERIRAYGSNS